MRIMKRICLSIVISLLWFGAFAQEYDSPEYVSMGREMARSKTVLYPTAEEAQA
jgi:hypothetical protein